MKYSVLMSVYEKENPIWFQESMESMLNQTIKTDDFVLVEDGPLTKELEEIVVKYEQAYSDIFHVIRLKENKGLGNALRIGIETCKNSWIARMDSDDYSVPNRIEKEFAIVKENPEISLIGSSIAEFTDNIHNIISYRMLPTSHEDIVKYSKTRNPFGHPSVLLKKEMVLKAGNYRDYHLVEDYDLWIRMIETGAVCYNISEILVYMRIDEKFYQRRGGLSYLKSILKFKKEQYKKGYYSLSNYIVSAGSHIVSCFLPNFLRKFIYQKMLRRRRIS